MKAPSKTPYVSDSVLYVGDFQRGRNYGHCRPNGTRDWLLIYTADGAGRMTTPARTGATRPGDVTLYAPGDYHDYKTDPETGDWHLLWTHFLPRPSWLPWLRWPVGPHGVKCLHLEKGEIRDSFVAALYRMIQIFGRRLPNAQEFAINALEEALLWGHVTASRGDWMRTDPRVRKAMDYLAANVRQPFRLETVARHSGLSVSRLAHLFKSETGTSLQQFIEQQRMWHAARLLRLTSLGIAEVAAEVGYEDAFYFSNRFRRYAGKSPTQFRARKK